MRYVELEQGIIKWAEDRGLTSFNNRMTQGLKTLEETNELLEAINENDDEELMDAIGDVGVTLIIQAEKNGWTFTQCLEHAYHTIKDRGGKTTENGKFVKDS